MSYLKRIATAVGLMLMTHQVTAVQPAEERHFAALLEQTFKGLHPEGGPGCVAGISRNGRVLAERADGMANLELRVPLNTSMAFDIGSTSKQFTAASIAILARRGSIDLDADIKTYLPRMQLKTKVTVRQLLHHSGGIADVYAPLEHLYRDEDGNFYPSEYTLQMAEGAEKTDFEPGSKFEYSNIGYLLLGQIVERVSGQSLRAFADAAIFKPLGMTHTHFHDDHRELVPGRASAYSLKDDGKTWEWRHSDFTVMGDGGIYTTLEDLAKWYAAFADPSKLEGGRELLSLMMTPAVYSNSGARYRGQPIDYGFGIQMYTWHGQRVISHPGAWAGYGSAPFFFPDKNLAVITLCNYQSTKVLDAALQLGASLP